MSAYLIDVTNSFYVYSISYSVNVAAVLANKTFLVNINIDKSLGNQSTKPTLIKNKDNTKKNIGIESHLKSKNSLLNIPNTTNNDELTNNDHHTRG